MNVQRFRRLLVKLKRTMPIATPAVSFSSWEVGISCEGLWAFALRRWGASHLCRIHGRNDDSARIKPNHGQGQSRKKFLKRWIRGRFEDCRNQAILCHSIVDLMPSLLGHGGFAQVHRRGVLQLACCSVGHLQLSSKLLDITLAGCTPPISASCQNEDRPRAVTPCERRSAWACLEWFKPAMGCVEYEFFRNGNVGSKLAIFF